MTTGTRGPAAQQTCMPMNPDSSPHEFFHGGEPAVRAARRVLVVEDEFFLAVQIEEWLAAGGFEVVDVVYTADEAIAVALAERPGLVVMDVRLANDSDGIAAASEILARAGIRSIFATAYADAPTRARGEAARPLAWLRKPFTGDAVLKAVNDAFASLGTEDR